jgi:pyruvate formate lyase activating enzyme
MAATDGVMLDVKSWSSDDHLRVTGQDNALVKKNLLWLARNGKLTEVRTVVVPDLFDTKQTVSETARALKNAASDLALIRYKIIRYRPMGVRAAYSSMAQPDDTLLNQLADMARSEGMTNVVIT